MFIINKYLNAQSYKKRATSEALLVFKALASAHLL